MKLSHFSPKPLLDLYARKQIDYERKLFAYKPEGLWLSVDGEDDWKTWARENRFRLENMRYRYRITLDDDPCVLHLTSPSGLHEFEKVFGAEDGITSFPAIDWQKVAELYSGIIIAPYQWRCRMNMMWYYGWDCASGCIWDVSVIKSFKRIKL